MTILFLIAGLILLLAGGSWFTGAATVGVILTVIGALGIILPLIVAAFVVKQTNKQFRRF